jgi:hypothetical protein
MNSDKPWDQENGRQMTGIDLAEYEISMEPSYVSSRFAMY